MEKENKNIEQEFMKKAVTLAKDRKLTAYTINDLLDELKIGESEQ